MSDPDQTRDEMNHQSAKPRIIYDSPFRPPNESLHWERVLGEATEPEGDELISTHKELIAVFQSDVNSFHGCSSKEACKKLALWSCVIGYAEALSTHKDERRRYSIFPVPFVAISKLVDEFVDVLNGLDVSKATDSNDGKKVSDTISKPQSPHRCTVQSLSNSVWKRAQNKAQMKDELHANSLYICLCGDVDNKSLDCFGAALLTVIGMNILGFDSYLTLSEDHAYESHWEDSTSNMSGAVVADSAASNEGNEPSSQTTARRRTTCEVAIPGNTKASQLKRGREIMATFTDVKSTITPETSWLYMASNAVICDTPGMALAAMLGNVNCDVEKFKKTNNNEGKPQVVSAALYKLKRDMLWILYDAGYMAKFPFALMELGECEEHFGSERGMRWVDIGESIKGKYMSSGIEGKSCDETMVLWNEKLFHDAINISRTAYNDSQVYPYLYAGHYHKDADRKSSADEYRLVEALRLYSEASRVASKYKYETKDCMQLMKHMTTVASLIQKDFLLSESTSHDSKEVRVWTNRANAVSAATWVLAFYDSLMLWEENEGSTFVEVLCLSNKFFLGRIFQYFTVDVRVDAVAQMHNSCPHETKYSVITERQMLYFTQPRSRRLAKDSLLTASLSRERIAVKELDMALPINEIRQRKRVRRG